MSGQLYTVDKCEIYDVYYYVFCSVDNKNSLGHIRTCLYCDANSSSYGGQTTKYVMFFKRLLGFYFGVSRRFAFLVFIAKSRD